MNKAAAQIDAALPLAICVPARNEATRLPRLFAALESLVVPPCATVCLCLMLDSCTDTSDAVAKDHAARSRHPVHIAVVHGSAPNAGTARHAAMTLGITSMARADGILLTTDADSWPRADWLCATTAALAVSDLVAGDVVRDGGQHQRAQERIEGYYARLYALRRHVDPVAWEATEVHHHASGANMAMRVSTYQALGGFAPLASGEDARLVDDAARAGFRVRRDAASVVHTSARRQGRAHGGLATTLDMLDRTGLDSVCVTHPADQLWQYRHHALARRAFAAADFAALSSGIGLSIDHLRGVARDCPNAEAFAMRVVPEAPGGMRQVPITMAEGALDALAAGAIPARAA